MDSRRLNYVFGGIALMATAVALALALRKPAPAPMASAPAVAHAPEVPSEPHEPGGTNAIAALALQKGGPRTPTTTLPEGAPRRSVASFRVAPTGDAWSCVRVAGAVALGGLATGASVDASAEPEVQAACGEGGEAGRVRLTTSSVPGAKPGEVAGQACVATVDLPRSVGGKVARREIRSEPSAGTLPGACEQALASIAKRVSAPE